MRTTRARRLAPLAPLALAFLLTGCLDYEETITFHDDGSGSVKVDHTLDLGFLDEIKKLQKEKEDEDDPIHAPTAEDVKKQLGAVEGLTLRAIQSQTQGRRTQLKVDFDWKDLKALKQLSAFDGDRKLTLEEKGQDQVVFRYVLDGKRLFGMPTDGKDGAPQDEVGKKIDGVLKATREKAKVKLTLRFPDKVLETNATPVEGDEKAVSLTVTGKEGSKPRLGSGDDVVITATLKRASVEKLLQAYKAAKAAAPPPVKKP